MSITLPRSSRARRVVPARGGPDVTGAPSRPGDRRSWLLMLGGCVLLAVLSLALPGEPTYDPTSWIIWGREIAEGTLSTTRGPSWKPLPILFTTPFSLFGDGAAPELWLVVA